MQKNGREVLQNFPPQTDPDGSHSKKNNMMIAFVSVVLKEILELGRDYKWKRPATCPRCNHYKVWSHGYVPRLFDGFDTVLLLKCYRCPNCGCVITLRPDTHFPRIQASVETIRSSLQRRIETGRWPPDLSRPRQRHWFRNLKRRIAARLTNTWTQGIIAAFDHFVAGGQVPVSNSI